MGGYIRMDKDLDDDPRVLALADRIAAELKQLIEVASDADLQTVIRDLAGNAALGSLFKLWRYGDTHLGRHNRLKGALHGAALISKVTALPAGVLRDFPGDWLRMHEDGSVELPDYSAKNNLIDRDLRREKTRERVRRFRERQRENMGKRNGANSVTHEALQRDASVTTGTGTGTGPGTGTTVPGPDPSAPLADAARGRLAARDVHPLDDDRRRIAAKGRT